MVQENHAETFEKAVCVLPVPVFLFCPAKFNNRYVLLFQHSVCISVAAAIG